MSGHPAPGVVTRTLSTSMAGARPVSSVTSRTNMINLLIKAIMFIIAFFCAMVFGMYLVSYLINYLRSY